MSMYTAYYLFTCHLSRNSLMHRSGATIPHTAEPPGACCSGSGAPGREFSPHLAAAAATTSPFALLHLGVRTPLMTGAGSGAGAGAGGLPAGDPEAGGAAPPGGPAAVPGPP